MTDPLAHFDELMRAALDAEVARSTRDVQKVVAAAHSVGQLTGSRRIVETARVLGESVERFSVTVDAKWKEYMKPRLSALSDSDRPDYINAAVGALNDCVTKMKTDLAAQAKLAKLEHIGEQVMTTLEDIADRERRRLVAELNLYSTLPQTSSPSSTVHVTTHGSNSPVVVGSGNKLEQSVSTTVSWADLSKALADLLTAIDSHHAGAAPELRQVIEDAKTEAEKPEPNRLRLKGSLAAAKDVVQTFGGLSQAWESVINVAGKLRDLL